MNTISKIKTLLHPWWAKLAAVLILLSLIFGWLTLYTYLGYQKEQRAVDSSDWFVGYGSQSIFPELLAVIPPLDTYGKRITLLSIDQPKNSPQSNISFVNFDYLTHLQIKLPEVNGLLHSLNKTSAPINIIRIDANTISSQDLKELADYSNKNPSTRFRIFTSHQSISEFIEKHPYFKKVKFGHLRIQFPNQPLTDSQIKNYNSTFDNTGFDATLLNPSPEAITQIAKLKNLQKLIFGQPGFVRTSDTINLPNIHECTNVSAIELYNFNLSPQAGQSIAKMKQINTFYSYGRLTDKDLTYLENLPNLTWMYAADSQITDEGLNSLRKMKNLHYLNIDAPNMSPKGLAELKKLEEQTKPSYTP